MSGKSLIKSMQSGIMPDYSLSREASAYDETRDAVGCFDAAEMGLFDGSTLRLRLMEHILRLVLFWS